VAEMRDGKLTHYREYWNPLVSAEACRDEQGLVTGATGKTGRRLLTLLDQRSVPAMAASREPPNGGIRFDWTNRTTWTPRWTESVRSIWLRQWGRATRCSS